MKEYKIKVSNPKWEARLRYFWWFLFFCAIAAIPLAFYLGWQERGDPEQALYVQIENQEKEIAAFQAQIAISASNEKVAQQAAEQTRKTIRLLEQQIYQQQQDLAFYKGVLAPASRQEGLVVRNIEMQRLEKPGHYRYKLNMTRIGKDDALLEGTLEVFFIGKQKGKDVALNLSALSEEHKAKIPFSFRYFQSIPESSRYAELAIPEGTVISKIRVLANLKGQSKTQEQVFDWTNQD